MNSNLLTQPLFLQIFRFGLVGFSAACLHFLIVIMLVQNHFFLPLTANIFGFVISFHLSYFGHRFYTFPGTMESHQLALPKLFFLQMINFAANESLFYLFLSFHLSYPVALFIVLAILPIFTFIFSKFWVFRL